MLKGIFPAFCSILFINRDPCLQCVLFNTMKLPVVNPNMVVLEFEFVKENDDLTGPLANKSNKPGVSKIHL